MTISTFLLISFMIMSLLEANSFANVPRTIVENAVAKGAGKCCLIN